MSENERDERAPFFPAEAVEAGERGDAAGAALALAAAGIPVFPCRGRTEKWTDRKGRPRESGPKTPLTPAGFKDASTDPKTVREWFRPEPGKPRRAFWGLYARPDGPLPEMYGIPTGSPSGMWVFDVDGEKGAASLRELEASIGPLPKTPTVETPGDGVHAGKHFYFRFSPEAEEALRSKNKAGIFGAELPGLDVRCVGGYAIGPWSFNAEKGRGYRLLNPESPLADAPAALLELIRNPPKDTREEKESRLRAAWTGPLPGGSSWADFAREDFARMLSDLRTADEGLRHPALIDGSFHCFRLILRGCIPESARAEIRESFRAAALEAGLPEEEVDKALAYTEGTSGTRPLSAVEEKLRESDGTWEEWRKGSRPYSMADLDGLLASSRRKGPVSSTRAPAPADEIPLEAYADEEDGPMGVPFQAPAGEEGARASTAPGAPASAAQAPAPSPGPETYRRPGPAPDMDGLEALGSAGPVALTLTAEDAEAFRAEGVPCVALLDAGNVSRCMLAAVKAKREAPLVYHEDGGELCRCLTAAFGRNSLLHFMGPLHPEGTTPSVVHATAPGTLAESVKKLTGSWREEALDLYRGKESAAARLDAFLGGIAARAATPATPTGFDAFDKLLDGGLYEGLYVLGAMSSQGKSALALQIADQVAERGRDVLFFTLEMSAEELMARSVSRATREFSDADGKALARLLDAFPDMEEDRRDALLRAVRSTLNAKSARRITTGALYEKYSPEELALIDSAVDLYGLHADRLFFVEGVGDFGVEQIRERVERHAQLTGTPPAVFVDYVQILAPHDVRATDKTNMDHSMRELRRIARDFKCVVFGISSFNRASYRGPVTMEAFKESGAIEYSSDVLLGLQFKGVREKDFDADEAKARVPRNLELVVLKNRSGKTGSVFLDYFPIFNLFREA